MSAPPFDLNALRAEVPILERLVPLNTCSQAPLTSTTRAAAERFLTSWDSAGMDWEAWMSEVEACRASFASLINASPDEIAVCPSVSGAASALATALDYSGPRNRIVSSDAEFPAVGQVWLTQRPRGAEQSWVPVRNGTTCLEDWAAAIDDRVRLVSVTHAYFLNGAVQDVAAVGRVARASGARLFVDAYQSAGVVPIDVKVMGVDFLASGTLKFLMGTPGIAFLYVRRELIPELEPLVTGWFGRANPFTFDARTLDWSPRAARFDGGTPPLLPAYVSRAAMDRLGEIGPQNIHLWTQHLARHVRAGARARDLEVHGPGDPAPRTATTGIVCDMSHAVEDAMRGRGFIVSARGPVVRIAPHYYNTTEEIDRALDALVSVVRP